MPAASGKAEKPMPSSSDAELRRRPSHDGEEADHVGHDRDAGHAAASAIHLSCWRS